MKRYMALFACLILAALSALSLAEPMTLGDDLAGVVCWPEGSDESHAAYVFSYRYPQLLGDSENAGVINEFYAYTADDDLTFKAPMDADSLPPDALPSRREVSYEITCNNDEYFSVLLRSSASINGEDILTCSAQVFCHTSGKAGHLITLPYLLGILEGGENDTWLEERQKLKANTCVNDMIWAQIEARAARGESFLPDFDRELLEAYFYPEEDFYLDEHGNPVFFLQPGIAQEEAAGILLFTSTLDELLDEI